MTSLSFVKSKTSSDHEIVYSVVFTNSSNSEIILLISEDEYNGIISDFELRDDAGKEIAFKIIKEAELEMEGERLPDPCQVLTVAPRKKTDLAYFKIDVLQGGVYHTVGRGTRKFWNLVPHQGKKISIVYRYAYKGGCSEAPSDAFKGELKTEKFTIQLPLFPSAKLETKTAVDVEKILSAVSQPFADAWCTLEKVLGYKHPKFNCQTMTTPRFGNVCDSENPSWYQEYSIPVGSVMHWSASITAVDLQFENEKLRAISVSIKGIHDRASTLKMLGLEEKQLKRGNLTSVDHQHCGRDITCLSFVGFEHMGPGEIDCPKKPVPTRTPKRSR